MNNDDLFSKLNAQFGDSDALELARDGLQQIAQYLYYYFDQLQEQGFTRQEAFLLVSRWQRDMVALAKKRREVM